MNRLLKLENTIQPYAWGSHAAIAELLGQPAPTDHPQAELWMGAHAKAPSKVWYQGRRQGLDELIRQDPTALLGPAVVDRFGPRLPFLFKVLAVEKPLSIQAHPSKEMARRGFARENAAGIPLSAPHRNYRDDQHKPECICALTPFQAMCGFRKTLDILDLLAPVWPGDCRADLEMLKGGTANDLRRFFTHLVRMEPERRGDLVSHLVSAGRRLEEQDPVYGWMVELATAYPNDIGVLSPALLHLIELQPQQALFLPAGRLHAYLNGMAVEIMANSDNVLRGGLTAKHIDVDELLRVMDFSDQTIHLLETRATGQERVYVSRAEEFRLSLIRIAPSQTISFASRTQSPEILLCTEGAVHFDWEGSTRGMDIQKGESVFVPAAVSGYHSTGEAVLYRATVGI